MNGTAVKALCGKVWVPAPRSRPLPAVPDLQARSPRPAGGGFPPSEARAPSQGSSADTLPRQIGGEDQLDGHTDLT